MSGNLRVPCRAELGWFLGLRGPVVGSVIAALLTAGLVQGPIGAVAGEPVTGVAKAVDGDTLVIGSTEIDLYGIDAPELGQTCHSRKKMPFDCGALSRKALINVIGTRQLICKPAATGIGGRMAANCFLGWLNVNEQMVIDGRAFAQPIANNPYTRAQTFAEARKEGLWRGSFDWPWDWRKANPGPNAETQ